VKSIRRSGLLPPKEEDWEYSFWCNEIGLPPSTFMATQPRAGHDSDPLFFARLGTSWYSDTRAGTSEGDGYIVVISCPWQYLAGRLRGIWATWDVMFYYMAGMRADDALPFHRGDYWDPDWYDWSYQELVRLKRRDIADVLQPGVKKISRNPEWLLARALERPNEDCQVVAGPIEPEYILDIVRVYDSRSRRIVSQFDPSRQRKLKHKRKTFASLFRNHVLTKKHE
jgi:hypothetical protein